MIRSLDSEVILSLFKLLLTNILLSKRLQTYNGIVKKIWYFTLMGNTYSTNEYVTERGNRNMRNEDKICYLDCTG